MTNIQQFEIYWANLDPTLGSEIKKTRPCIVVSPDVMNKALHTVLVAPLTSRIIPWPFRVTVKISGQTSSAACDQLRCIDISRLTKRIGVLSPAEAQTLSELLREIFE